MADVDFTLDLKEQVSPDARRAARAMENVEKAMGDAGKAAGKADAGFGKARGGIDKMEVAFGAIKGAAATAAVALTAVGVAAVALGAKFASATLQGSSLAQSTRGLFSVMTKSAAGGQQALDDLFQLAGKTAQPIEELSETYGALMQAGFSRNLAKQLTEIEHNVRAITKEPDIFRDKMRDAMKELKLAGKISDAVIEDLGEQLGGPERIWAALAKAMGKTQDEVVNMAKAGKFNDLKALYKAVGSLGKDFEGASLAAASWEKRVTSLKEIFFTKLGAGLDTGFGDVLDKATKWLSGPEGDAKIKEWTTDLQTVINEVRRAWPIFEGFGTGVSAAFSHIGTAVKFLGQPLKLFFGTSDDIEAWAALAAGLGYGLSIFAAGAAAVLSVPLAVVAGFGLIASKFMSFFVSLKNIVTGGSTGVAGGFRTLVPQVGEIFTGLIVQANVWGSQIIDALASGITGSADRAVSAIQNVANRIQSAFSNALKFGSPPKVFIDMGRNIPIGVGRGIESEESRAVAAVDNLAGGMEHAMRSDLQLHSPSKLFEGMGKFTTAGAAGGIDAGAKDVKSATQNAFGPDVMTAAPMFQMSPEMLGPALLEPPALQAPAPDLLGPSPLQVPPPDLLGSPPLQIPQPQLRAPSPEMFAPAGGSAEATGGPGGGGGGNTVSLTLNVYQQPGEDGESFAQRVGKVCRDFWEGEALAAGV